MKVEIGTEATQLLFWEYINRIFFAVHDGRSMPLALTDHTTCLGLGLIYY
jgi:hypothetical protein